MSETESETGVVTEVEGGLIQYIDMGHYTLEIDNRGPVQQRRQHPKALTSVGVTPQVRQELEERIENEVKPLIEVRNTQQVDGSSAKEPDDLPPVEDWEGARARQDEAHEAIRAANEQSGEAAAEQQAAVADNLAEPTWGSASQESDTWTPPWESPGNDDDDDDPRNQGTEETLAGRTQEPVPEPVPDEPPLPQGGPETTENPGNPGEGVPPSDVDATDPAAEYAREQGIDLSQVKGTGAGGRVTKADVEAHETETSGTPSQGPVT